MLASRLTETSDVSVALLEAGPPDTGRWDSWKIRMPSALTYNLNGDKYNWDYWTTPQQHLNGRRLHQPRGKTLGGSSSLNAMAYIRGHALDYERWGEEGATGWDYASCLPYFRKAQRHMDGASRYTGGEGPLEVTRGWYDNAFNDAFVKAGQQAGYAYTPDLNGHRQEGVGPMHMTVRQDGARASTSSCYLRAASADDGGVVAERPNLDIRTGCRITRVILEGGEEGGDVRAVGVEFLDERGETQTLRAAREVILSLGAIGTPHCLMHSGVGDAQQLEQHGLPVRVHSAGVGANLQDHIDTYIQFDATEPASIYPYATWGQPWKPIAVGLGKHAFPQCARPVLTGIYLCQACSCLEIEDRNARARVVRAWHRAVRLEPLRGRWLHPHRRRHPAPRSAVSLRTGLHRGPGRDPDHARLPGTLLDHAVRNSPRFPRQPPTSCLATWLPAQPGAAVVAVVTR